MRRGRGEKGEEEEEEETRGGSQNITQKIIWIDTIIFPQVLVKVYRNAAGQVSLCPTWTIDFKKWCVTKLVSSSHSWYALDVSRNETSSDSEEVCDQMSASNFTYHFSYHLKHRPFMITLWVQKKRNFFYISSESYRVSPPTAFIWLWNNLLYFVNPFSHPFTTPPSYASLQATQILP